MARLFKKKSEERSLWQRMKDVAFTDVSVLVGQGLDDDAIERLEELLLASDFGVSATLRLVDHVQDLSRRAKVTTEPELREAVEAEIERVLDGSAERALSLAEDGPSVILVAGVNGSGKTTTIAKLAHRLQRDGHRVLLAAGDTFRAGAIDQLREWAERVDAEFVGAQTGADPAAVAFDAIDAAERRGADVIIVDTAGRLHTQHDLMEELAKIQRVVRRKIDGAPHEALLVLDATVGQNAVMQVRMFRKALDLTGLVLAKLDSTAKGGIVIALTEEFGLPIKLVGTGETLDDLEAFDPGRFAEEVLTG